MQPITVDLYNDPDAENPCDWDGWKVFSFSTKHRNFTRPESIGLSLELDEYRKPIIQNPGLRRKMDVGLAYFLSYYEHGACQWSLLGGGPQCRWDTARIAGVLIWGQPPGDLGPKTKQDREKDAERFLKTYTAWCNGWVYSYSIDDPEGKVEGGCCGYYDLDHMFQELAAEVGDREVVFKGEAKDLAQYHWPPKVKAKAA